MNDQKQRANWKIQSSLGILGKLVQDSLWISKSMDVHVLYISDGFYKEVAAFQEGKSQCISTSQASGMTLADVPLARACHMAKTRVIVGRHYKGMITRSTIHWRP